MNTRVAPDPVALVPACGLLDADEGQAAGRRHGRTANGADLSPGIERALKIAVNAARAKVAKAPA